MKMVQQRGESESSFLSFFYLNFHELPFSRGHSDIFCSVLYRGRVVTASLGVGWRLEGPRAHGAAPGRAKGAMVGAHEDYMRSCSSSPGRIKGAWGGAQKDQGRVGQHLEGPRARWVALERTKDSLVGGF